MTPEPKVEQGFIELWKNNPVSADCGGMGDFI